MFRVAFALVCWVCISRHTVEGLQRNGDNVCPKQKLVRVDVVYPELNGWNCTRHYPNITCERIRSGHIDVHSLHFLEESLTCCPGWSRSAEDGEDANSCMMPCEDGYYGENCELECQCIRFNSQPGCNRFDGTCNCSDGWTGHDCDQSCPPMTYGPNCNLNSSYSCVNGATNNPSKDGCLCSSSEYWGTTCEYVCPNPSVPDCGAVRCEQCAAGSNCDVLFNSCLCKYGWWGRYCTDLCPLGSGGLACEDDCCSKNGRCYEERVKCSCKDGFIGEACEEACNDGRYGRGCKQECQCPSCDHVTGECETCPEGFKGPMCLAGCSPSEWGPSCSSRCSCPDDVACDVFTGSCTPTEEVHHDSSSSTVAQPTGEISSTHKGPTSTIPPKGLNEEVHHDSSSSTVAQPTGDISSTHKGSTAIPLNVPNDLTGLMLLLLIPVCSGVALLVAVVGFVWYRRRSKADGNQESEDVPNDIDDNGYYTVGSSHLYESTIAQPIGTISLALNASNVYETQTEVESSSVYLISESTDVFVRHDTN